MGPPPPPPPPPAATAAGNNEENLLEEIRQVLYSRWNTSSRLGIEFGLVRQIWTVCIDTGRPFL